MPFFYFYNTYYLIGTIFVLIASILMIYAQAKVSTNYSKYSKVPCHCGLTGSQVARQILDSHGLNDVPVNCVKGKLTDHYDPRNRTLSLSQGIYEGTSVASVAVAAHECGHAIQHQESYKPLQIRSAILPLCSVGQYLGWVAVMVGLIFGHTNIAWIGVILMSGILLFQLVTLPVEFDASNRALSIIGGQYLLTEEYQGAKNMLGAAALTYVASVLATLMSLLRVVLIIIGSDRN